MPTKPSVQMSCGSHYCPLVSGSAGDYTQGNDEIPQPTRNKSGPEHRWSALKRGMVFQWALELQARPSFLPPGPSPSPILLSCPHHPGLGIWQPLLARGSLGTLPQEMRLSGKWAHCGVLVLWAPEALFLCHLKHFIIESTLNASPDVSSDLLFIVK